jgi:hypothetical protein
MAASAGAALALTAALLGDAPAARTMAGTAVEAARDMELPEVLVMALTRVTESAVVLGEHDRARRSLTESVQLLLDIGGRAWVAPSLELAAVVNSSTTGSFLSAPRLFGAAEAIRELTGESFRWPHLQAQLDRAVEAAGPTLGQAVFAEEWARGRHLGVEDALALARAELEASH